MQDESVTYGVRDREGQIRYEGSRKDAFRARKEFGGLVVRNRNGIVKPCKRRKIFLWFFLAVQAIFLIWIITGVSSAGGSINSDAVAYCNANQNAYISFANCVSDYGGGEKVGTAIGAGLVITIWVVVDFLIGLTYGIYRLVTR